MIVSREPLQRRAPAPPSSAARIGWWGRGDVLLMAVLACAACLASLYGAQQISPKLIHHEFYIDTWFEADAPRVLANMSDRFSNHAATGYHPLFPLITFPAVKALQVGLGLTPLAAAQAVLSVVAALWVSALFMLFRLMGCRRLDATVFSLLASVSASAMFWFTIPETWPLGSLTVVVALVTAALADHRARGPVWYVLISAATLGITVTNWMAGLLATFVQFPWRRALQLSVNAFCLVTLLWWGQKLVFPSARLFLRDRINPQWILQEESGSPLNSLTAFMLHPIVMPEIAAANQQDRPWPRMTIQHAAPGSGSVWGAVGVWLWAALLGLGLWGLWTCRAHHRLRLVFGLTLLGQLVLHSVYGAEETFLYSLHWAPLLVVLAAFGTLTRARMVAVAIAGLLVLCAAVNNLSRFEEAVAFAQHHTTPAQAVRLAMQERPRDPWPRRSGHVVLARPGSPLSQKGYHEPGGSFSPGPGSFGVSVWVADAKGQALTTSDTIPMPVVSQRFVRAGAGAVPSVETDTAYYTTRWSAEADGEFRLVLTPRQMADARPMLVVRSVGPAGGPVRSLDWNGERLLVNGRYALVLTPQPLAVHLGREGSPQWMSQQTDLARWEGNDGWGAARLQLSSDQVWTLSIRETASAPAASVADAREHRPPDMELPDARFADGLRAQADHLVMGLVGREARPGEPVGASQPRLRETAEVVVALAQAGYGATARELSAALVKEASDGRQPEDAGGLTTWALGETAGLLRDPAYDRWAWPTVQRAAERMAADEGAPRGREPKAALWISAMHYAGLREAAILADRLGETSDAARWRQAAERLRRAWSAGFAAQGMPNEWAVVGGLWPSGIAVAEPERFHHGLEARWKTLRDADGNFVGDDGAVYAPRRTSLEIAEAHQWLLLGRLDRVWTTLEWFWNHQSSPGLYTWWEGREELFITVGNFLQGWEPIRGWVDRPQLTPHYGAAAQMLLLQLEMLAAVERTGEEPTLVIGAGIPASWLSQPMRVRQIQTRVGAVDWSWDGQRMRVAVRGRRCAIRLGPAFPSGTSIDASFEAGSAP